MYTSVTATFQAGCIYLLFVVLAAMYLVNSNFVHTVFICCVLFLCITSLLLDIGLVLAYLLFLMSGHNKLSCKKKKTVV